MVIEVGVGWQATRSTLWRAAIRAAVAQGVAGSSGVELDAVRSRSVAAEIAVPAPVASASGAPEAVVSVWPEAGVPVWVVASGVVKDCAALRAVRSAAVASLWRAVEIVDQRVAAARAVMRSTAAKRE
jgi:hypothetical protein